MSNISISLSVPLLVRAEDGNEVIRLIKDYVKREVVLGVGGTSLAKESVRSHEDSESLTISDLPMSLLQTEIIKNISHGNSLGYTINSGHFPSSL